MEPTITTTSNTDMTTPKEDASIAITRQAERSLLKTLAIGEAAGILGVMGYSLTIAGIGSRLLFVGLLLSLAGLVVGFFTGTLFGMPKRNDVANSDYTLNNSLVEISEWLTKIIVGLGLVNLKQIPGYLLSLGQFVSEASGSRGQSLDVFAMSVAVYFSVFGLYVGYNYMRLVLSQKYKLADDNILRRELEKTKEEKQNLQTVIEEKKGEANTILQEVNNQLLSIEDEKVNPTLFKSAPYMSSLQRKAEEKLVKGLQNNPNDPQKGQWGQKAENNFRRLTASVTEITKESYRIMLEIMSTDPNNHPLNNEETVLFALHQTFGQPPFRYRRVENGRIQLTLFSSGSFTVGVLMDRGETELELDLAELPGVSEYFKTH